MVKIVRKGGSLVKKLIPVIVLLLAAIATFFVLNSQNKDDSSAPKNQSSQQTNLVTKQACELFTLEDAKKVLGDTAVKSEEAANNSASSEDIEVSQCIYQLPAGGDIASIASQKQASLLVRSPKTQAGSDSNNDYFNGTSKPSNTQVVSEYGDVAFWSPDYGQLNILKSNQWYILQVGPAALGARTQDDAKKMASIIISKL